MTTDNNTSPLVEKKECKWSCDVWHGEGITDGQVYDLVDAKKQMRTLRKQGKESIRMYAYDPETSISWYYKFDSIGKIIKETNNLGN